jgi:hypothetical protein
LASKSGLVLKFDGIIITKQNKKALGPVDATYYACSSLKAE